MKDEGKQTRGGGLLSQGVIHNVLDTNKHNKRQGVQVALHRASYILISQISTDTSEEKENIYV